jgi:hypothetical protein
MAYPTSVNGQISDSITQAGVNVQGQAPSAALGILYQTTARAPTDGVDDASGVPAPGNVTAQPAPTAGAGTLYSFNTATTGTAAENKEG